MLRWFRTRAAQSAGRNGRPGIASTKRILLALSITPVLFLLILYSYMWSRAAPNDMLDFGAFWASGRLALDGQDPYGPAPAALSGIDIVATGNANPPITVIPFQIFALFSPLAAFEGWRIISLVIFVIALGILVHLYHPSWLHLLWAFAFSGFWATYRLGQIYMPLLLLVIGAWVLLERRHSIAAGVLIGVLLAIKPNLAVWSLLLLAAGHSAVFLASVATAGVLSVIPIILYGPGIYLSWLRILGSAASVANGGLTNNASLFGLANRLGMPALGYILALALLLLGLLWARRTRHSTSTLCAAGLVLSLLIAPLAWVGYSVLLLPAYCTSRWSWPLRLSAALLLVPGPLARALEFAPYWPRVLFGSAYCWALALALIGVLRRPSAAPPPDSP